MSRPAGHGLVRIAALLGAGLLAVMLLAAPPTARSALGHAVSEAADDVGVDEGVEDVTTKVTIESVSGSSPVTSIGTDSSLMATAIDSSIPAYWTGKTVEVHIGPSAGYVVIGQLPRAARLQIVGRDESSRWIAI